MLEVNTEPAHRGASWPRVDVFHLQSTSYAAEISQAVKKPLEAPTSCIRLSGYKSQLLSQLQLPADMHLPGNWVPATIRVRDQDGVPNPTDADIW